MKRLLLVLAAGLLLAIFGPVPAVAAHHWWPWGHHSKAKSADPAANPGSSAKTPKSKKAKKEKAHHDKQQSGDHLYSVPNSVGWWRKGPGPAGAGS